MSDDLRTRVAKRVQDLHSQGATDEEILAQGPTLAEEARAAMAKEAATPAPEQKSMLSRVPGALAGAADFVGGAGNAFANRMADSASMGALAPEANLQRAKEAYYNHLRMSKTGMVSPNSLRQSQRDYEEAQAAMKDSADHKVAGFVGSATGAMMSPGTKVSSVIGGGTPGFARSMVAGGVGAGADATGRALIEGKNFSDALDQGAGAGMLGAGLGGSMHAIGESLRNPLSETGATIQALQRGREFLGSAQNKALPKGMPGIGALAYDEGEKLGAMQAGKLASARKNLETAEAGLPLEMDEPISVAGVHRQINRGVERHSNSRAVRGDVENAAEDVKDRLSRVTRQRIEPIKGQDVVGQKINPVIKDKTIGYKEEPEFENRVTSQEIDPVMERQIVGRRRVPVKGKTVGPGEKTVGFEDGDPILENVHVGYKPGREIREDVQVGTRRGDPIKRKAIVGYEPGEEFLGPERTVGFKQGDEIRTPQATPRDLVQTRREVRRKAGFGTPETPENAPYRELYDVVKNATHDPSLPAGIGGKLAASDSQFAADMQKLAEGNELIFGNDSARAMTESVSASKIAGDKLGKVLNDTRAGGAQLRILEKIRALGPEYAASVDRVAAKIADEGSTFGLPKTLSSPGKWAFQLPMQNVRATNVQLIEPFTRARTAPAAIGSAAAPLLRDPLDALLDAMARKKKPPAKNEEKHK